MAKIVLTFDTEQPGQQAEAMLALRAYKWKRAMREISDWLRNQDRHGPVKGGLGKPAIKLMRAKILEVLESEGLDPLFEEER